MKKESVKERKLRLWKTRQEAEGHDVSGVTTLEQAEHFFDKKPKAEAPAQPKAPSQKKASTKKTEGAAKKTTTKKTEGAK